MVEDYFASSHGLALSHSGLLVTATCVDCHGAHGIEDPRSLRSRVARANIPVTCGKCHAGVTRVYLGSVHGKAFQAGNMDVPVCTDCHRSHAIRSHYDEASSVYATRVSDTCLRCHESARYLNKYGFPGLRGKSYLYSFHGAASKLGDTRVANCGSCHGSHDIRPSRDPESSTNPKNLARSCGKCHAIESGALRLSARIHVTRAGESHPVVHLVERLYVVLIAGTMLFFLFYIATDLRRALAERRGRRG